MKKMNDRKRGKRMKSKEKNRWKEINEKMCSPHHSVLGDHERWWCYASINLYTWPQTQHGGLNQVLGGGNAVMDREGDCWWNQHLATWLCAMPHKQKNRELTVKKISVATSPLTSGCLIHYITIVLIIICATRLSERPTKFRPTPKINWRQG